MADVSAEQDIQDQERRRCAALTAGDVDALAAIVSDDLVHIHGNGHVDGRADYLAGVENKFIFHRIDRGDLDIRVYGDCAVVVGPLEQTVQVRGIDKLNEIKAIVSQTWVRTAGQWRQNTCHMHFLATA